MAERAGYRGRIAPSPTGYLHLGHARTFWIAMERARAAGGVLIFRNEDLDRQRVRSEFVTAMYEDLRWLGIEWQEGPYSQSERREVYVEAWRKLRDVGVIYPCTCSRKDLAQAAGAPHEDDGDEVAYPGTCRKRVWNPQDFPLPGGTFTTEALRHGEEEQKKLETQSAQSKAQSSQSVSWRFRVPEGEVIRFDDALAGPQEFVAGREFGDFLVWRRDDVPAYQLACVADEAAMGITEVVRGADLLKSTARQLLLYRALGEKPPAWAHAPLMKDEQGVRLAKRHDALSLRQLRSLGRAPHQLLSLF
jgi:glutamyl/glutaminyl-tRNA synthetase